MSGLEGFVDLSLSLLDDEDFSLSFEDELDGILAVYSSEQKMLPTYFDKGS